MRAQLKAYQVHLYVQKNNLLLEYISKGIKKKINYGTFIGALLNELEKEHIGKRERDKKSKKGEKKNIAI